MKTLTVKTCKGFQHYLLLNGAPIRSEDFIATLEFVLQKEFVHREISLPQLQMELAELR